MGNSAWDEAGSSGCQVGAASNPVRECSGRARGSSLTSVREDREGGPRQIDGLYRLGSLLEKLPSPSFSHTPTGFFETPDVMIRSRS